MAEIDQLVSQARTCFQARDYETCLALASEALRQDPSNAEVAWLMKEAQRQWEDQRSLEEFEIYVENAKKEATDLFDKEQYEQCMGMFRFLLELEPENHTLRDYLKLSQQMFLETIGQKGPRPQTASVSMVETKEGKDPEVTMVQEGSTRAEMPSASAMNSAEVELAASIWELEQTAARPCVDPVPPASEPRVVESPLSSTAAPHKLTKVVWVAACVLVLAVVWTAGGWFHRLPLSTGLEIQSNPEQARIFIDGQHKGQTPLRLQELSAGNYALRLEKEGYSPFTRTVALNRAQTILIVVQLEKSTTERETNSVSVEPLPQGPQPQEPQPQELQPEAITAVPAPEQAQPEEVAAPIAFSVIHHHVLGGCTGRLKISEDTISFRPSGLTRDGFSRKISQIDGVELDDLLTIRFKDKNYRFEALARNKEESLPKLATLYAHIKMQMGPRSRE